MTLPTPMDEREAAQSVWIVYREDGDICCYAHSEDQAAGAAIRPGYRVVRYDRRDAPREGASVDDAMVERYVSAVSEFYGIPHDDPENSFRRHVARIGLTAALADRAPREASPPSEMTMNTEPKNDAPNTEPPCDCIACKPTSPVVAHNDDSESYDRRVALAASPPSDAVGALVGVDKSNDPSVIEVLQQIVRATEKLSGDCEDCYLAACIANGALARMGVRAEDRRPVVDEAAFTTGHCENHRKPGGCPNHNLQCGWPECDRRPRALRTPEQKS